mgnify:CR=1 FL=1
MQIASGTVDITPSNPVPLVGYFLRRGLMKGINDRLEANFFLTKTSKSIIAIVGLDALFGSNALRDRILSELGYDSETLTLILVASHTHFAPGLDRRKPRLGATDENHLQEIARRIARKISAELRDSRSKQVRLSSGRSKCNESTYRRAMALRLSKSFPFIKREAVLSPNTKVKHPVDLELVVAEDVNGEPQMIMWSWPCHAVSHPNEEMISADFPGAVREVLRRHLKRQNLPIIYMPGFAGDIRPYSKRSALTLQSFLKYPFSFIPTFKSNTPESFRRLCDGVSNAALDALRSVGSPVSSSEPFTVASVHLPLEEIIDGFHVDRKSESAPPTTLPITLVENDLVSLLFMGAETCSTYAPYISRRAQPIDLRTGYSDECFGYLPIDRQISEGGLEGDWFFHRFSLPGKFKRNIQDLVLSTIHELYDSVSATRRNRDR